MAYLQMHGWEHRIRDTSRAMRRVFGKSGVIGVRASGVYWVDSRA